MAGKDETIAEIHNEADRRKPFAGSQPNFLHMLIMICGIVINFSARHLPGGVESRILSWAVGVAVFAMISRYAKRNGDRFALIVSRILVVGYALGIVSVVIE